MIDAGTAPDSRVDDRRGPSPQHALARLRSPVQIRARCRRIARCRVAGRSTWFDVDAERLEPAAADVAALTRERYPGSARFRPQPLAPLRDRRDRPHGPLRRRLREQHGDDRGARPRADRPGGRQRAARRRRRGRLALSGARHAAWSRPLRGIGAGEPRCFRAGLFSSRPGSTRCASMPRRSQRARRGELARRSRLSPPILWSDWRASAVDAGARSALAASPRCSAPTAGPAGCSTALRQRPAAGAVTATALLGAILDGLAPIWPLAERPDLAGSAARRLLAAPPGHAGGTRHRRRLGTVPQAVAVADLLAARTVRLGRHPVTDIDAADRPAGVPQRRPAARLRRAALTDRPPRPASHPVGSELVVEWRALTVALIDELAVRGARARLQDAAGCRSRPSWRAAPGPPAASWPGPPWRRAAVADRQRRHRVLNPAAWRIRR